MRPEFSVCDPGPLLASGEWDDLLTRSRCNTVFMTASWLRASREAEPLGDPVLASVASAGGRLVAGTIVVRRGALLELLGTGSSDYLDVLTDSSLDAGQTPECVRTILGNALEAVPGARGFRLRRLPDESGTVARLASFGRGWWLTRLSSLEAPTMDISAAQEALNKKSLKRHENALERAGRLTTVRLTRAEEVLPRLPAFFEQHIRRCAGTSHPSPFLAAGQQEFYRALVRNLAESGWLRYTELRLDGAMVAAHLGAHYGGRFSWYKPTFDPGLARLSPGEVLLKRLIEQAVDEGAQEFDFTVGDEAFKKRFATRTRTVADVHLTRSALSAAILRSRCAGRGLARVMLRRVGLWDTITRAVRARRGTV